jgi:hypothetical protein
MTRRTDTVVKFPIGRVVREPRVSASLNGSPELDAIEQAAISVRRAITTLRRQEATLNLLAARAQKKVPPEQQAAAYAENTRRIYKREAEDRPQPPPLSEGAKQLIRELVAELSDDNGDNDDGGSAA